MKKEEKDLLLRDLCSRLPYGIIVQFEIDLSYDTAFDSVYQIGHFDGELLSINTDSEEVEVNIINENHDTSDYLEEQIRCQPGTFVECKPYLRSLSTMTDEEKEELLNLLFDKEAKYFYIDEEGFIDGKTSDLMKEGFNYPAFGPINVVLYTNWLNSHHFDYRGLIEKGLALEALEGMYNN